MGNIRSYLTSWRLKLDLVIPALVLAAILIIALALTLNAQPLNSSERGLSVSQLRKLEDHSIVTLKVGSKRLEVVVVNQPSSLSQGLGGRQEIGADGMLFVLPQRLAPKFWMKNMQFDLDMIWIDQGRVADISSGALAPPSWQQDLSKLDIYQPNQAVELVLEVPANSYPGIELGDEVRVMR